MRFRHGRRAISEANKALVRHVIDEAFNKGNLDIIDEVYSPDYIALDSDGGVRGPEGFKLVVSMTRDAFPDIQVTIDEQIAEKDKVVTRWTARGTHNGELWGLPPTGRRAVFTGISIILIVDGKYAEGRVMIDSLSLMRQLGVMQETPGTIG